jgi:hypothetical protein
MEEERDAAAGEVLLFSFLRRSTIILISSLVAITTKKIKIMSAGTRNEN